MTRYTTEQFDAAYSALKTLKETREDYLILERMHHGFLEYIGLSARNVLLRNEQEPARRNMMLDAYSNAKQILSKKGGVDISVLLEDSDFIEGLAGHVIKKIMEERRR